MTIYKHTLSVLCITVAVLFIPLSQLSAQDGIEQEEHPRSEETSIGEIDFRVDCSEEVRDDFDHALGMLHHMMYVTSREHFEAISDADPNCAMAYWGIATTLFQPLWGTRPSKVELQRGWQAIRKAENLVESEREKLLIESTKQFFRNPGEADFRTRIKRWTEAVEAAYDAYPADPDIAALYGLTRLTLAQFADDRDPLHDEAEEVLRGVYERVPAHPGAIHYTIHATDVEGRADHALDMVEAYSEIAPAVPHALHMPTHIYVRLGNWPRVIDWNLRSAEAALNHPVDGAVSHHFLHAIDYLVYAYLQQGESGKAEAAYQRVLDREERYQASYISAYHFAAIPARLAVERRDWERAAAIEPRTPDYLPWDASPWPEGLTWYARGLGAVHTGDIESARKAEDRLKELRDKAHDREAEDMAAYIEIDRLVLAGWIAHAKGNDERAVELMREAAGLEEAVEKHPVTPGALQPPYEALGDLLMELHRPEEALEAYRASDSIWPGRLNTLMGAALAARLIGKEQTARNHIVRLINGSQSLN